MKQYLNLLQNIIDNGVEKESGRANMPNTIGISHGEIKMNLQEGFPLLTTKKMYWKAIIHELLWFLRGETNIKYLVDNNVNIWNGDAYRWYLKYSNKPNCPTQILYKNSYDDNGNYKDVRPFTMEEFISTIKDANSLEFIQLHLSTNEYTLGDLGKVYGYQWRNQNGVDQIKDLLEGENSLITNPYSRYHIIDAWNKADFKEMALPPCHLLYQFIVRPLSLDERIKLMTIDDIQIGGEDTDKAITKYLDSIDIPKFYLDLNMYQRSCDTLLGVPFNCASMSCLLKIFAKTCNMLEGVATWIGGDTHLYVNHIPLAKEQISREPRKLPELKINKELNCLEDILALTINDFELCGYDNPHPAIKAELFTGLKK